MQLAVVRLVTPLGGLGTSPNFNQEVDINSFLVPFLPEHSQWYVG